jgi:polysaccharide deacetylase family protein (PEP-CTERM system associated)
MSASEGPVQNPSAKNSVTVDVEDWFHILDAKGKGAPDREGWEALPSRIERNMERLLELFAEKGVRSTLFWLGWAAERMPALVRRCHELGHEIASHGHEHLLAYQVGRGAFAEDIRRAKGVLEGIVGAEVIGFRVPGFSFTRETPWAYEELARAGYRYSSSVFPAARGHGGFVGAPTGPHVVETPAGPVHELPITTVGVGRARLCLFGGGYLRITPWPLLLGASELLNRLGQPVIYYLHPREIDPEQPRMKGLPPHRYFKYYVNLRSTEPKLRRLLAHRRFVPMREWL